MSVLLLFGGRLRSERNDAELSRIWTELFEIATHEDGFGCTAHESYSGSDGSTFGVYTFRDLAGLHSFKADERHRAVQRRASEFFSELNITVASVEYEYSVELASPSVKEKN